MAGNYRIYRRWIRGGPRTLIDTVAGDATSYVYAGAPNQVCFIEVRPVSAGGKEDNGPLKLVRVAFDAAGNLITPAPNKPIGLTLRSGVAGAVVATWTYVTQGQGAAPAEFRVYVNTGAGFDFDMPAATVKYTSRKSFSATLGPFADATVVRVTVGARSADGVESRIGQAAAIRADAAAPAAVDVLITEVIDQ